MAPAKASSTPPEGRFAKFGGDKLSRSTDQEVANVGCQKRSHNCFHRNNLVLYHRNGCDRDLDAAESYGAQEITPSTAAGPVGPAVPMKTPQVQLVLGSAVATAPHPVVVTFDSVIVTPCDGA